MKEFHVVDSAELMERCPEDEYTEIEWRGIMIAVRTTIPLRDVFDLIGSAIELGFDPNTGVFAPQMAYLAFRANVVMRFAAVTLPDQIEDQYRLLYAGGLYRKVWSCIDEELCSLILRSFERCLDIVTGRSANGGDACDDEQH